MLGYARGEDRREGKLFPPPTDLAIDKLVLIRLSLGDLRLVAPIHPLQRELVRLVDAGKGRAAVYRILAT